MQTVHNPKLTSSELAQIWANYQNDTMARCIFQYFLKTAEDPDILSMVQQTLEYPQSHIPKLTAFFQGENWPVPQGFTESDVNLEAPRLFSDDFVLIYLYYMGIAAMNAFDASLALSTRSDVRQYFSNCVTEAMNANQMTVDLLLQKGLYVRPPYIVPPKGIDFVTDRKFLGGWFGEKRPLLSMEITNLFANLQRNNLGKALMIAFSQVAETQEVRQFMVEGKKIAEKHVDLFSSKLNSGDLPAPTPSGETVTDSTMAPFSDKLMMFQTTALIGISIGYYGLSLGTSLRKDLAADYVKVSAEAANYAAKGAKLMIDHGWLEEPPQAPDRDQLAKKNE